VYELLVGNTEAYGEKAVPVSLSLPQVSHGLTWDQAQTATGTCRPLLVSAMTRSFASTQLYWVSGLEVYKNTGLCFST